MLTLWDLLEPAVRPVLDRFKPRAPVAVRKPAPVVVPPVVPSPRINPPANSPTSTTESAEARYERITREMLAQYDIKVRKWRSSMSGMAWELRYRDGSTKRMLESPRPCGPMSAAIFLHEVGHHAIGFNRYKPRCLEEYHAWAWSLAKMEALGLNVTDAVRFRMHESLWYAVAKAQRRGLRELPPELAPFQERPRRPKRGQKTARSIDRPRPPRPPRPPHHPRPRMFTRAG